MQCYTVLDATPLLTGQALCLRDLQGRYHVARTTAEVPAIGQRLSGSAPRIGFSMLVAVVTGQVFRVVFESLDCSQLRALELLRGRCVAQLPEVPAPDMRITPPTWHRHVTA